MIPLLLKDISLLLRNPLSKLQIGIFFTFSFLYLYIFYHTGITDHINFNLRYLLNVFFIIIFVSYISLVSSFILIRIEKKHRLILKLLPFKPANLIWSKIIILYFIVSFFSQTIYWLFVYKYDLGKIYNKEIYISIDFVLLFFSFLLVAIDSAFALYSFKYKAKTLLPNVSFVTFLLNIFFAILFSSLIFIYFVYCNKFNFIKDIIPFWITAVFISASFLLAIIPSVFLLKKEYHKIKE